MGLSVYFKINFVSIETKGDMIPEQLAATPDATQQKQQQQQQQKAQIDAVLKRVLTREAAVRLNNVKLVKPQKAEMIEHYIYQMASKKPVMLNENDILNLLGNPEFQETAKVVIKRKVESDDEWATLEGDEY